MGALLWIRIRIDFGQLNPDGSRRAKITQNSEEISFIEVVDVLFYWLKASPVSWACFMEA
jgi:hypothetical protein